MLNKKGFTIAEVLVSFSLITLILISIVGSTIFYRDKLKEEEVKSQLVDFKNTITKVVYDDIVAGKITYAETCIKYTNCINLVGEDEATHTLRTHTLRIEEVEESGVDKRGAYISYDGIKYMLPDSDLAEVDENGQIVRVCDFVNGLKFEYYDNRLFTIKTTIEHKDYDVKYDIMLTIS